MTLEQLIQELERAKELATPVVLSHGQDHELVSDDTKIALVSCLYRKDAQSIAIRHNTADEALSYLKSYTIAVETSRVSLGSTTKAMALWAKWHGRATKAESEVERLREMNAEGITDQDIDESKVEYPRD